MTLRLDRAVLTIALLVMLGGYLAVFRPAERAIAERYAQLDDDRVALADERAADRRAAAARTEARTIAGWIRTSGLHDDRPTLVARFLRELDATAHADDVRVSGVDAGIVTPVGARANAPTTVHFDEIPLTVALRGTYGEIIRVIRDLGRGAVVLRIGVDALGDADRTAPRSPALHATLRVTLLRLAETPHDAD